MKNTAVPEWSARQSGFTIVEFLVAMTIGLIVSLALGQIFLGVRQSFSSQEDSSRMQENMRFAAQALSRALRQAGYRNQPAVEAALVFPRESNLAAIEGADNVSTSGLPAGNSDTTKPTAPTNATVTPDRVTVRFQGSGTGTAADGTIVDCLGNSIDYGVMATNTFAVRGVTKADGTISSSLFCSTDGNWPANNELIPDVDNMQILYGVDTDANGAADKYVRYGDIGTVGANEDKIVSVRIWLLLRSATPTQTRAEAASYMLAGTNFIYNDRFQRRVLYMTVNLRNRTL